MENAYSIKLCIEFPYQIGEKSNRGKVQIKHLRLKVRLY